MFVKRLGDLTVTLRGEVDPPALVIENKHGDTLRLFGIEEIADLAHGIDRAQRSLAAQEEVRKIRRLAGL